MRVPPRVRAWTWSDPLPDDFEPEDLDDGTNTVTLSRQQIRNLEKRAKDADTADLRAGAAERELAFIRAGVPDTPAAKYFVKGYDGEVTAEAIRTAAVEAGFLAADQQGAIPDDERGAHERMTNAASGAGAPPAGADIEADLAAAKTPEAVYDVMVKHGQWPDR